MMGLTSQVKHFVVHPHEQMLPQFILSPLLHNVWDIAMVVALTSKVQHLVVLILIMVVIDLDVTEVADEYNVTATDVEFSG